MGDIILPLPLQYVQERNIEALNNRVEVIQGDILYYHSDNHLILRWKKIPIDPHLYVWKSVITTLKYLKVNVIIT